MIEQNISAGTKFAGFTLESVTPMASTTTTAITCSAVRSELPSKTTPAFRTFWNTRFWRVQKNIRSRIRSKSCLKVRCRHSSTRLLTQTARSIR